MNDEDEVPRWFPWFLGLTFIFFAAATGYSVGKAYGFSDGWKERSAFEYKAGGTFCETK